MTQRGDEFFLTNSSRLPDKCPSLDKFPIDVCVYVFTASATTGINHAVLYVGMGLFGTSSCSIVIILLINCSILLPLLLLSTLSRIAELFNNINLLHKHPCINQHQQNDRISVTLKLKLIQVEIHTL